MRHNAICDLWAEFVEEVGGQARRECYSAQHSSPDAEAWLDVQAIGIPELSNCLFDVTVRNPRSDRYVSSAAKSPGATAAKAGADKAVRYPAKASGKQIITLSQEVFGRMGESAEHVLQLLGGH